FWGGGEIGGGMRCFWMALTALMMLLLHSCIEGDEDIVLRRDGSLRYEGQYAVPTMLMSGEDLQDIRSSLSDLDEREEGVTVFRNEVEQVGGKYVIRIGLEAKDGRELQGMLGVASEEESKGEKMLRGLLGDLSIKMDGLEIGVRREVNLQPLVDEFLGNKPLSLLGSSEFRYTVRVEQLVRESNAHELQDGGRTMMWKFQLAECADQPLVMEMKVAVPIPWWVYAAGAAVLLLLVFGLRGILSRKRRKRLGH
ncbi:MAG: hypothetical protein ACPGUY_09065, partial [Akkermansiaceae bacterium]